MKRIPICIGDSLTQGVNDERALGWPGRLARVLLAEGSIERWYNLGVGGDPVSGVASRWFAEADYRTPVVQKPVLIFCLGAVDAVRALPFDDTVETVHDILRLAARTAPTFLLGPPPMREPDMDARTALLDEAFASLCRELDLPFQSLYAKLRGSAGYLASLDDRGVHPSAAGYDLIAGAVLGWKELHAAFVPK